MHLSRSDRRAMLIVFVAILAATGGILLDRWLLHPLPKPVALDEAAMDSMDHLWGRREAAPSGIVPEGAASGYSGGGTYAVPVTFHPETFPFDPNTADSTTLLRLGLAPWQVRSIYKYRARGGRFHTPEDFKRLYGMTPELWERLAPVINIHPKYQYYTETDFPENGKCRQGSTVREGGDSVISSSSSSLSDTLPSGKFTAMTPVDLNAADTVLLKRIPGIASYRARQIVQYRDRLGGFVSTRQLTEVEAIPEELYPWFKVETGVLRKLNVNTATVSQLGRHPYMGFTRARAIDAYRRTHGSIRSLDDLRLLPDFTEEAIARLQPYIEY